MMTPATLCRWSKPAMRGQRRCRMEQMFSALHRPPSSTRQQHNVHGQTPRLTLPCAVRARAASPQGCLGRSGYTSGIVDVASSRVRGKHQGLLALLPTGWLAHPSSLIHPHTTGPPATAPTPRERRHLQGHGLVDSSVPGLPVRFCRRPPAPVSPRPCASRLADRPPCPRPLPATQSHVARIPLCRLRVAVPRQRSGSVSRSSRALSVCRCGGASSCRV